MPAKVRTLGLPNAQHDGHDIIVIKVGIGAAREVTRLGRTQRGREARVFNRAGRKVTQAGGRDLKGCP